MLAYLSANLSAASLQLNSTRLSFLQHLDIALYQPHLVYSLQHIEIATMSLQYPPVVMASIQSAALGGIANILAQVITAYRAGVSQDRNSS